MIIQPKKLDLSLKEKIGIELKNKIEFMEQEIKTVGKTYLFDDDRAGVILRDNGLPYGSKERHLIWEYERKRRAKNLGEIDYDHLEAEIRELNKREYERQHPAPY